MHIWIDIENPPQVQYLAPFVGSFEALGHDVTVTARDHAITLELLRERNIDVAVVGSGSSSRKIEKIARVFARAAALTRLLIRDRPDLVVATSRAAGISAWAQRIPACTFSDYEHVDFHVSRLLHPYLFHPDVIDTQAFVDRGLRPERLVPFPGLKEAISFEGVDIWGTEPLALREGARVHLRVEEEQVASQPVAERPEGELPTLLERLKDVVGTVDDLPEDSSTNLDHYLYGHPKR